MKKYREILFILLMILIFILTMIPSLLGAIGSLPPRDIRQLAKTYLNSSFNIYSKQLWTASPEVVAAIVWDYRGLDTFYETIVFYTAIIGCIILYREIIGKKDITKEEGLSIIVKRTTAIAIAGIMVIGISTILHGMITPGGGFQGGAIIAVAPVIAIVVFSRLIIDRSRINYSRAIIIRNIAIVCIALTAIAPLLIKLGNAFVFQNQSKAINILNKSNTFSYPSQIFDVPMGGSIWFLNLFEGLAVSVAFLLAFSTILYSESISKEAIAGEDRGY